MKKLYILLITLLLVLFTGCYDETNTIVLPDLNGMSRNEIESIMKDYNVKYTFEFSDVIIGKDYPLDTFVSYGNGYKIGDTFSATNKLKIFTTVLPLTYNKSKDLKIDFEWENKSVISDGVGEVSLISIADGDTATFKDLITGTIFKIRFLGIDTPEVWGEENPWGQAASRYTKSRLNNAKQIIIEGDYDEITRTYALGKDMYDRNLGFVWVDGVLLNLEIIEHAYSNSTLRSPKYKDIFLEASFASMKTGRRFFGETDPEYDYENKRFY